jgi:uncharacterized protein YodC (DUF2158 family)
MPAQQWKSGDQVKLKSSGPQMTVKIQYRAGTGPVSEVVLCQWFDKEEKLYSGEFAPDSLDAVK